MALTKEAKTILRKVAKHILAEPKRLNMADWIIRKRIPKQKQHDGFAGNIKEYGFARCNTAACIAGWIMLLYDGKNADAVSASIRAREILGLDLYTGGHDLFAVDTWDQPYQSKYMESTTVLDKAKVAAAYINHYIKTR